MMFTSNQNRNETSVTDSTGHTLQNVSYDPWGNIVDDESGRLLSRDEQPELLLERGFTGHEHLPHFGLINMNARLYEPLTARFLSPDPEVQAPDFTQNLNRYSYCLNNPLRYTDPTGMGWMRTQYDDDVFYLYRDDVNCQDDITAIYGPQANLEYIGNYFVVNFVYPTTGEILHQFILYPKGQIMCDGASVSEYNEYNLHIASFNNVYFDSDNGILLANNYVHYHYLGNDNPKYDSKFGVLKGSDCYSIAPINLLDYYAYLHDLDYDAKKAAGIEVVLSTNTTFADLKLVARCINTSVMPYVPGPFPLMVYYNSEQILSDLTSTFFSSVIIAKNTNLLFHMFNLTR